MMMMMIMTVVPAILVEFAQFKFAYDATPLCNLPYALRDFQELL